MLIHIFNTTGKRDLDLSVSYEDMIKKTYEDLEGAKEIVELVNSNDKAKRAAEKLLNRDYIMIDEDGKYFINDMLIKLDLYTYKLEQSIYKNGISIMKNYNINGVLTTNPDYDKIEGNLINTKAKKISFKDAFLRYVELNKCIFTMSDEAKYLIQIQPLIVDAYNKLGTERVKQLKYCKKAIMDAIINLDNDRSIENKIAKMLQQRLIVGFNTTTDIQAALADIYDTLGLDRAAKASTLTKYFEGKGCTKRVDGKVVRGFEIYRSKFIFE